MGDLSNSKKGLLLVVNPNQNKVRLEVGYELEDVYQDAFVAYIEHRQMVPFFKRNEVAMGIIATIELMVSRAQFAKLGKEEPYRPWLEGSGGGGAVVDANINRPDAAAAAENLPVELQRQLATLDESSTPLDIVNASLAQSASRNSNWDLPLYTNASRRMLKTRKATIAQLDNTVRIYQACGEPEVLISDNGIFAVVRYQTHERLCAPWFLMKEDKIWRIDILPHAYGLRFNFSNEWYFDGKMRELPLVRPYWFAFVRDWYISKKGHFYMYRWQMNLDSPYGKCVAQFKVRRVPVNMPAYNLGLRAGDQPLSFNGETIKDNCHLLSMMFKAKVGEPVVMEVERSGQRLQLEGKAPPHVGQMEGPQDKMLWTKVDAWLNGVRAVLSKEDWENLFPDHHY